MTPELISIAAALALSAIYIALEIVRQEIKLKKRKDKLASTTLLGVVLPNTVQNKTKKDKKNND